MEKRILIVGAGPCGLGAGCRLDELGYRNWEVFERFDYVGGLASSFTDREGFTWDLGGHVLFSNYERVNQIIDYALGDDCLEHERQSFIRLLDSWIPYPFQNNLRYLPDDILIECLMGLHRRVSNGYDGPTNFKAWVIGSFGEGIARYFMLPYNQKVWSHDLEEMSVNWIADRIAVVDFEQSLRNVIFQKKDIDWGPNRKFKFPFKGGTGELFRRISLKFKDHLSFDKEVDWIDVKNKKVGLGDGSEDNWDIMITTMPLDQLVKRIQACPAVIMEAVGKLISTRAMIVGIGIHRPNPSNKCWMYFPEEDYPFYRTTYFSNYSPHNVPDINRHFSLMSEISYSRQGNIDKDDAVDRAIRGLSLSNLINDDDHNHIQSVFTKVLEYAYPVPTQERDSALAVIQSYLEANDIYSRGRFGSWKYEVGNMDHSIMQGIEIIDRVLMEQQETVICGDLNDRL